MDSIMETLNSLLKSCETLLSSVEEPFWSRKIRDILERNISFFDKEVPKEILSWYGGMGSFNDLQLSKFNGHLILAKDEDKLNDKLDDLREEIYKEAVQLLKL
jgi:hypothetical protein